MTKFACISADSHVIEPGDLWLNYIDPKLKTRAPKLVHGPTHDYFTCEGVELLPIAGVASVGKASEELTAYGRFDTAVRRGSWDPHARKADMASDGIEAEVIYPTMALRMFAIKDTAYQLACFQAYNNWIKDYCAAYPDCLKAIALLPTDDLPAAIEEMRRRRRLGLAGAAIAISDDAEHNYGSPMFDPLWSEAQALDLPLSLHSLTDKERSEKRDISDTVLECIWMQRALSHMVFGGVFERFPKLKIVSAENDAGWMAYFLERIDYIFDRRRNYFLMQLTAQTLPSEWYGAPLT